MSENKGNARESDKVTLIIENQPLECSRLELVNNSDYFKVMLEGSFLEREKDTIEIEGVSFDGMKQVISLLHNKFHPLREYLVLPVLEICCMLQFFQIKELCLKKAIYMLTPHNSISLWLFGDKFYLPALAKRAKLLALMEYLDFKETNIFEMNLDQICLYLGSVNLPCRSEMQVFHIAMLWYLQLEESDSEILIELLHCLNFHLITVFDIAKMVTLKIINHDMDIVRTLDCVQALKTNRDINHFPQKCIFVARSLMHARTRNFQGVPCILVDNYGEQSRCPKVLQNQITALYYDKDSNCMKKLMFLNTSEKATKAALNVVGYKHFVYYFIDNYDKQFPFVTVTRYDLLKETWASGPCFLGSRYIMQTSVCVDYLYMLVLLDRHPAKKMISCYDLKENRWMAEIYVPNGAHTLRCCDLNGELFMLDIEAKCGYFLRFRTVTATITQQEWYWEKCRMINIDKCHELNIYAVFGYKSSIFLKADFLHEFKLRIQDKTLVLDLHKTTTMMIYDLFYTEMEYVLCNDVLYTLYQNYNRQLSKNIVRMESFNINTHENCTIFKKSLTDVLEKMLGLVLKVRRKLNIFSVFHYDTIQKNELINYYYYNDISEE